MNPKVLKLLKKAIYPMIAIVMIIWVYNTIHPEKVVKELKGANYLWVGLAALAGLFSHFIRAVRWKLLIEPLGYKARVKTGFYAVMVGYTVNYVTPRMGEVARCALMNKTDNIPIDKLVGTVFIERVFDVIVTLIITLIAVFLQYELISEFLENIFAVSGSGLNYKIILLMSLAVIGVAGILVYRWIKKRDNNPPFLVKILGFIGGLLEGAKSIFKLKKPWLFLFYTLTIWLMYFLVSYIVFFALTGTSHLGLDAAVTTLIVATIAVIIPLPGGIGSFHKLVPLGLVLYGIDIDLGTSYAFISHGSQMLMIFIVGGISMLLVGFEQKKLAE
ncbi:MAG: hypothetical protein ACI9JN_001366 [Bacteroidia bacterium]